jgi:heat shock protein HslJ
VGAARLSGDGRRHESPGVRPAFRPGPFAAAVAAALGVAGCGMTAGSPPDVTGEWELVEFSRGGAIRPDPAGGRATLIAGDGELGGTSFCNTYSGTYRLDGDDLSVSGLGGTEIGCAPELMDAEAAYLEALATVDEAATSDGYLVLTGPDVELRFRPLPAVAPSDLTGTRWVLETLLEGEIAASTTGRAELRLADDGTLIASTGCRELTGRWTLDGDVVRVLDLRPAPSTCPPDAVDQDEHVVSVLSGNVQVSVAENSLTVTGRDGLGLVYRVAG